MTEYRIAEHNDLVHVLGRRKKGQTEGVCFWTGSGIEINAKAGELWVEVEADFDVYEPWISWSVNGAALGRMPLGKGRQWICLFRGMNPEVVKQVRILKDVQAMSADGRHLLIFHTIRVEGELVEPPTHARKIEFIGDSITSGEGSIGAQKEEDWVSMLFSAGHDYAVLASDALDAEFHIISQSGWGTYVSWDNHPECTIPPIYEQVCGLMWGERQRELGCAEAYDFSAWQPDVVVINLGTNDNGAFRQPAYTDPKTGKTYKLEVNADDTLNQTSVRIVQDTMKQFLYTLRKDNPQAFLLWVYGMLGHELAPAIEAMVAEYRAESGDDNAAFLLLPNTEGDAVGARWHPGLPAHQAAAHVITEAIRNLGRYS